VGVVKPKLSKIKKKRNKKVKMAQKEMVAQLPLGSPFEQVL